MTSVAHPWSATWCSSAVVMWRFLKISLSLWPTK